MEIKDKIGVYPNVAVKPGTPAEEVKPAEFDTRELLEADLKTHLYEFGGYCFNSREGHTDNVDTFFDDFIGLLDRQAAITKRETLGDEPFCDTVKRWLSTDAPEECHGCEDGCWEELHKRLSYECDTCEPTNEMQERIKQLEQEKEELREALEYFEMGQMYSLYQAKDAVINKWESDYKRLMEVVKTQAKSFGKIEFDRNMANGEIKRLEEKYKRLEEERDNLELRCRYLQGRLEKICKLVNE